MALLRLPCSPSFTLSLQKPHNQSNNNNNSNLSFFCSLSRLSHTHTHTLAIKTKRVSHFVFNFSTSSTTTTTTTQDPILNESPEIQSETEQQQQQQQQQELSTTRLIAQNVPWTCTIEDIRALFEKHGTVLDVELSMHNKTMNRGLAFITMASPEEALSALNNLHSSEFEGRILRLSYARPKKKKPSPPVQRRPDITFSLFVANLSFEARDKDLREFFKSEGGDVLSVEIIFHDNPRRPSGYGFVSFKTKEEAEAALSAFQAKLFMGRPLRVARSRQFVKQRTKEGLQSNGTSTELNSSAEQAETADES